MRRWKRVVAILLIATLAFVVEGWLSSAQGAPLLFKTCTYTRTADGVRPPFSLVRHDVTRLPVRTRADRQGDLSPRHSCSRQR
ncbi:hypothetical protein [Kribbella catacumbae]|uniref:hypothetical protein n=1 Tax=Kribbella catacumbae TaxID=460086 RepID=UPI00039FA16D|nr:hypothetical protein [Kribbella catacumbae]